MNIEELRRELPADFHDESRVWVYQSSRPFIEKEETEINEQLHHFYTQWLSHGDKVKGWAKLLFKQFVVVMADETGTGVSGCSTDSSVRVIKSIERQYGVNMFDRMMLTFLVNGKVQMLPLNQLQYAADQGYINENTLLFNNIVATKKELLDKWLAPVSQTWLANRIDFTTKAPQ